MGLRDAYTSVLHSPNTLYANVSAQSGPDGPGRREGEVFLSTLPLTSLASLIYTVCWPLAVGGTGVHQDVWDPGRCLDLMAETGVDQVYAEPAYLAELVTAQRRRPGAPSGCGWCCRGPHQHAGAAGRRTPRGVRRARALRLGGARGGHGRALRGHPAGR